MKQATLSIIAASLLLSSAFAAEDLGEIIVTSTNKLPQKIKNSTANITVITAEDIQERGYQRVPEILSHTSGFAFASNGGKGQTTGVFLRGFNGSFVKVLIDGVAQTDYTQPSTASAIEHISIENIERIEIVKGAQSGVWGADAAAGVINIITKSAASDYAKIKLKAGSYSTYGIGAQMAKSGKWGSFYLAGTILDSDGFSAMTPESAENDGYNQKEFHLKTSINIDKHNTVSLSIYSNKSKFDYDTNTADDNSSSGENKNSTIAMGYRYKNEALLIDFKASKHTINRTLLSPYPPFKAEAESKNISLTARYDLGSNGEFIAGLEHTKNSGKTTHTPENEFKNSAVFMSYGRNIGSLLGAKTIISATLRYDDFDKFNDKTTYRFGIKRECKAIDGLYSTVNIYSAYKAPSITQFSAISSTLKPESIEGYEISIGYKKYITATYFRNEIKDKIIAEGIYPNISYKNSGDGITVDGIELVSEYAFGDSGFMLSANYTHLFDDEDDNGKKLQRIPKNSANLALDYYFDDTSHLGIAAQYIGKRRDADYSAWPPSDVTLPSYTVVNLTYNTKINNNLSLSAKINNILDKKYETVKSYSTEGRSFYATMEYKF